MNKSVLIILGLLLLICCCCSLVLGAGYVAMRNADITLNGLCFKGIDTVFANKPVPCVTDTKVVPPVEQTKPQDQSNTGKTDDQTSGQKTYSNSELSFQYPSSWTVKSGTDTVTVTTPEGDSIVFNQSVGETGNLSESTCQDFANGSLDTFQLEENPLAELVNSEVTTAGKYSACIFDIDSPRGGTTTHLRFVYIVDAGRGYMVKLDATDDSTLMSDMLAVVDSVTLK